MLLAYIVKTGIYRCYLLFKSLRAKYRMLSIKPFSSNYFAHADMKFREGLLRRLRRTLFEKYRKICLLSYLDLMEQLQRFRLDPILSPPSGKECFSRLKELALSLHVNK